MKWKIQPDFYHTECEKNPKLPADWREWDNVLLPKLQRLVDSVLRCLQTVFLVFWFFLKRRRCNKPKLDVLFFVIVAKITTFKKQLFNCWGFYFDCLFFSLLFFSISDHSGFYISRLTEMLHSVSQLFWHLLLASNSKLKRNFLSWNIWYVICVLLWIKYGFMRFANHCILLSVTFYTTSRNTNFTINY